MAKKLGKNERLQLAERLFKNAGVEVKMRFFPLPGHKYDKETCRFVLK